MFFCVKKRLFLYTSYERSLFFHSTKMIDFIFATEYCLVCLSVSLCAVAVVLGVRRGPVQDSTQTCQSAVSHEDWNLMENKSFKSIDSQLKTKIMNTCSC